MRKKSGVFAAIYALVARIPPGRVMTYGQIAGLLEGGYSPKLVGFALHAVPAGLPCHRVLNSKGEMAGGGIFGGAEAQRALLAREGALFLPDGRVDLPASVYYPDFQ